MDQSAHYSSQWHYTWLAELAYQWPAGLPVQAVLSRWGPQASPGHYTVGGLTLSVVQADGRYCLSQAPDRLSDAGIRKHLPPALQKLPITVLPTCGSTNDVLADAARSSEPLPAGTLVITETQDGGRGRWGRTWVSPPFTGLWFSLWCPRKAGMKAPDISLGAAVCVLRVLKKWLPNDTSIVWPNDIFIRDGKVGGILIEEAPGGWVAGIGLNVFGDPSAFVPVDSPYPACALCQFTQKRLDRQRIIGLIVTEMVSVLRTLETGEVAALRQEWKTQQRLVGRPVRLDLPDRRTTGIVADIDPDRGIRLADSATWFFPDRVKRLQEIRT